MSVDFILDTLAISFAVFFMTSPLSQAMDVFSMPAKVKYVNPINLLCFFLNCSTQLAYGLFLPVPPVVPCNAYGVAVGIVSTATCWWFARNDPHAVHWNSKAAGGTVFAVVMSLLIFAYAGLLEGAAQVGNLGMLVGIIMYGAPLSSLQEVLRTQSSETLPVLQSFLGFVNSSCWFTVGIRSGKLPVWGPNIIGMLLSLLQLALIYKYPARPEKSIEEDDPVPPLKEHSLADIVRDATGEFADTMVETSHGLGDFVKKSSQNFSQFFAEKFDEKDYIPLDGEPNPEEQDKHDKTKVIEEIQEV